MEKGTKVDKELEKRKGWKSYLCEAEAAGAGAARALLAAAAAVSLGGGTWLSPADIRSAMPGLRHQEN